MNVYVGGLCRQFQVVIKGDSKENANSGNILITRCFVAENYFTAGGCSKHSLYLCRIFTTICKKNCTRGFQTEE